VVLKKIEPGYVCSYYFASDGSLRNLSACLLLALILLL
jgi:hypothetical protein